MKWLPKIDFKFRTTKKEPYLSKYQTRPKAIKRFMAAPKGKQDLMKSVRVKASLMFKWRF